MFSIIYMIRIRCFGSWELIQRRFRRAYYPIGKHVSTTNSFRTDYSSIFLQKVQNLAVFSIIYMIRVRFFGPRELNQNGFSGARYFRRGKVIRGAIGAPSKSALWLGPARVIMTEAIQQWSGSVHSTTGQIGVVWLSHGNKLIRCHPTQLRRCSEREVSIASLKGLVQISVPASVTELTNALSPGQFEDLSTDLPTRDDLRFGEVDFEVPPVDQETMAPPDVWLFPSGTVVTQLQNTSTRLSSIPNPVSASSVRESDVQNV